MPIFFREGSWVRGIIKKNALVFFPPWIYKRELPTNPPSLPIKYHSSKIRGLCLKKFLCKLLQNLPCFIYIYFFIFSISSINLICLKSAMLMYVWGRSTSKQLKKICNLFSMKSHNNHVVTIQNANFASFLFLWWAERRIYFEICPCNCTMIDLYITKY